MKIIQIVSILLALIVSALAQAESPDASLLDKHPNLIAFGTDAESAYVHPSVAIDWLLARTPRSLLQGQVSACKIDGIEVAVSAPHVINDPHRKLPLPSVEGLGTWHDSADGREVSFAALSNPEKLGFKAHLVEASLPQLQKKAVIRSAVFQSALGGIVVYETDGVLELVDNPAHLAAFATLFGDEGAAFRDRLLKKAPQKPVLTMVLPAGFDDHVRGMSGSLVWQDGHPIGVFVAALRGGEKPPLAFIEPLLESARATMQSLK